MKRNGREKATLTEFHAALTGDPHLLSLVPDLLLSSMTPYNSAVRSISLSCINTAREQTKSSSVASDIDHNNTMTSIHASLVALQQSNDMLPIGPYDVVLLRTSWCPTSAPTSSSTTDPALYSFVPGSIQVCDRLKMPFDRSTLRLSKNENDMMDDVLIRQLHYVMPHILRYARYSNGNGKVGGDSVIPVDGSSVSLGCSMVPILGRYRYLIGGHDSYGNGKVGKSTVFPLSNQLSSYSSLHTFVNGSKKDAATAPLTTPASSSYDISDMDLSPSHAASLLARLASPLPLCLWSLIVMTTHFSFLFMYSI
jgi:hypothetical protein